jgi:hypothetical protein
MRELREVIIAWNHGIHWRPTRWQHTKRCEVKVELRSTSTGEVIQRLPADPKEIVRTGEWIAVRLVA